MKLQLFYDGDCPFCKRYSDILKLKNCYELEILNARDNLQWKSCSDMILDDGVILKVNSHSKSNCYQGVEALDMLLKFCQYRGTFFLLQKVVFSNKVLGNIIYSVFKFFRKVLLKILR